MATSIDLEMRDELDLPVWFDTAAPWLASVVFHLGMGLLVLFLAWFIVQAAVGPRIPPTINLGVTTDLTGPLAGLAPGAGNGQAVRDPMQNLINDAAANGWTAVAGKNNASGMLDAPLGQTVLDELVRGAGGGQPGSGGNGPGAGPLARFGPAMNIGAPGFFGPPTVPEPQGVHKVVYVIDHSGSMLDNFDFLREELKRSVNKLFPVQQFAVVTFAEDAEVLGPPTLQRATRTAQRDLANQVDAVKAQGENDGQLAPFQHAFEKAFAMKPELIYFLTDGAFDPRLFAQIDRLNAHHTVRINTLAFVHADPQYESQLKRLAKENGGMYRFVSEKDLGR